MFKITPVQDCDTAKKYADICKVDLKPGAFIYAMNDAQTNELMAISQFEIFGEEGYIYNLSQVEELNDFEALFILGRQTMNFIDICGAHKCRASSNAAAGDMLKALGFKASDKDYICDMEGFFDGSHCSGHKN